MDIPHRQSNLNELRCQKTASHLEEVRGLGHPAEFAVLELSLLLGRDAHLASEHPHSPAGGRKKQIFIV